MLIKRILAPRSAFWWLILLVSAVLILYFSLVKAPSLNNYSPWGNMDKIGHALAYMVFGTALLRVRVANAFKALIISFLASTLIELIQHFLPVRIFDVWDLFANFIGLFLAYIFVQFLARWIDA